MARGKFDESKDEILEEIGVTDAGLLVRVMSYNDGEPKIHISRMTTWGSGFTKLGRIAWNELPDLLVLLNKADEWCSVNLKDYGSLADDAYEQRMRNLAK